MFANSKYIDFILLMILGILIIGFAVTTPNFFTVQNILNIIVASSTIGILAVGAALVIGSSGIDMSVGAVMALVACAGVFLGVDSGVLVILLAIIVALAVGSVNGFLASNNKIPVFIITLATMSIARGLSYILTDGQPVYGLPNQIVFLGQGVVVGIPMPIILFALVALCGHIILKKTPFGVHIVCYGDNPEAVKNNGINIRKFKIILYILSSLTALIAGLVAMGRLNSADPSMGLGYELMAITAAIMGGTKLNGGSTSIIGAVLGALIIGSLQNGLNLLAIPSFYQFVIIGLALLLSVAIRTVKVRP